MKVRTLMTRNPACCGPETPLSRVADLMAENDCGSIPVCENEKLVGVVTDRDITCRTIAQAKNPLLMKAADVMTKEVVMIHPEETLDDAVRIMEDKQLRRLPVVEHGIVVGILSQADIAEQVAEKVTGELVREISHRVRKHNSTLRDTALHGSDHGIT